MQKISALHRYLLFVGCAFISYSSNLTATAGTSFARRTILNVYEPPLHAFAYLFTGIRHCWNTYVALFQVQKENQQFRQSLYAGSDLHGNNNVIGIIDGEGRRIFKKRVPNDVQLIRDVLKPYKGEMVGIAVESTYNWYWLVDSLMEEGYKVHLANQSAIQQYSGMTHSDDKHDAFWLAEMLRLGILPEGYIYPKEERAVRDLLRKRGHLVRLRTSLVITCRIS